MNNKTIWITGASSGIGKSLALKFAKEGWKVAISARRENLLNEISKSNESITAFPLDVTDIEKCKSVFSEVKEKLGEVDISVFCTGIHDPKSEKTLNLEKVREIMEVNFFGTINSIDAIFSKHERKEERDRERREKKERRRERKEKKLRKLQLQKNVSSSTEESPKVRTLV